ncbi:hypothetical protein CEP54_005124 [Fusarium duplospermum]|uniref:Uncharacterized protein n=1 Tax=Fusarium duplospermum TaxID=1325734 RepID=A0A428QE65_9HYPO|nr:hypothetical protein CEP54_005124 [Fusarium duplospermum]
MSDKKQSITLREVNAKYPSLNVQRPSWNQGKQNITLRPTQDVPLILVNDVPLKDLQANTTAGKVWIPEEDEDIDVPPPVVHGTIKLRTGPSIFGWKPTGDYSTGTTQGKPKVQGTVTFRQDKEAPEFVEKTNECGDSDRYPYIDWDSVAQGKSRIPLDRTSRTITYRGQVPPGFTEAHRGQANLLDCPLDLIPSEYSHQGAQGSNQVDAGQTPVPLTPCRSLTPTDVYSSASSYISRNGNLPPIRTARLNPVANNFTPRASPMVSTDKETPRAPASFSRLGQPGPLSPELARDKMYLDNQAKIQWSRMFRPVGVGQQVRENEDVAGQDSHENRQVIEDEREHADAVNDWFWAQAKQAPAPKPEEPKE